MLVGSYIYHSNLIPQIRTIIGSGRKYKNSPIVLSDMFKVSGCIINDKNQKFLVLKDSNNNDAFLIRVDTIEGYHGLYNVHNKSENKYDSIDNNISGCRNSFYSTPNNDK